MPVSPCCYNYFNVCLIYITSFVKLSIAQHIKVIDDHLILSYITGCVHRLSSQLLCFISPWQKLNHLCTVFWCAAGLSPWSFLIFPIFDALGTDHKQLWYTAAYFLYADDIQLYFLFKPRNTVPAPLQCVNFVVSVETQVQIYLITQASELHQACIYMSIGYSCSISIVYHFEIWGISGHNLWIFYFVCVCSHIYVHIMYFSVSHLTQK